MFGTLVLPFFALEEKILGNDNLTDYTGNVRIDQFIAQFIGIGAVGVYTFTLSYFLLNLSLIHI